MMRTIILFIVVVIVINSIVSVAIPDGNNIFNSFFKERIITLTCGKGDVIRLHEEIKCVPNSLKDEDKLGGCGWFTEDTEEYNWALSQCKEDMIWTGLNCVSINSECFFRTRNICNSLDTSEGTFVWTGYTCAPVNIPVTKTVVEYQAPTCHNDTKNVHAIHIYDSNGTASLASALLHPSMHFGSAVWSSHDYGIYGLSRNHCEKLVLLFYNISLATTTTIEDHDAEISITVKMSSKDHSSFDGKPLSTDIFIESNYECPDGMSGPSLTVNLPKGKKKFSVGGQKAIGSLDINRSLKFPSGSIVGQVGNGSFFLIGSPAELDSKNGLSSYFDSNMNDLPLPISGNGYLTFAYWEFNDGDGKDDNIEITIKYSNCSIIDEVDSDINFDDDGDSDAISIPSEVSPALYMDHNAICISFRNYGKVSLLSSHHLHTLRHLIGTMVKDYANTNSYRSSITDDASIVLLGMLGPSLEFDDSINVLAAVRRSNPRSYWPAETVKSALEKPGKDVFQGLLRSELLLSDITVDVRVISSTTETMAKVRQRTRYGRTMTIILGCGFIVLLVVIGISFFVSFRHKSMLAPELHTHVKTTEKIERLNSRSSNIFISVKK